MCVAFNVPVPEWSQRGQSGVPVASDQRWSRAATHQGKWYGGPSETQVSSNSVNSERRMLTECSERVMVWYDSGESSDSGNLATHLHPKEFLPEAHHSINVFQGQQSG